MQEKGRDFWEHVELAETNSSNITDLSRACLYFKALQNIRYVAVSYSADLIKMYTSTQHYTITSSFPEVRILI